MLSFRNLSYENENGNEHHLQNGVTHNGVINNIDNNNSHHKLDAPMSNGTVGEHQSREQTYLSRDYPHVQEPSSNHTNKCRWRCKITANAIDAWSRILFPLAYGLFIVAYWIIYSSANTDDGGKWMTDTETDEKLSLASNVCALIHRRNGEQ